MGCNLLKIAIFTIIKLKTRQNRSLHHPIGKDEAIYKTFSFHMSVNIKIGTSVAQF